MGELFANLSDLMFTLAIGYMGAIEFFYVMRHLYHWSFNHGGNDNDDNNLENLQENLHHQLIEATNQEDLSGHNAMRDGVSYKDGYRIDLDRFERGEQEKSERRKQLEKEYAEQKKIKEQIEEALRIAEAAYNQQKQHNVKQAVANVEQTVFKKDLAATSQNIMPTKYDSEIKEKNQNEIYVDYMNEIQIKKREIELEDSVEIIDENAELFQDIKSVKSTSDNNMETTSIVINPTEFVAQQTIEKNIEKSNESPSIINEELVQSEILISETVDSDPYILLSVKPNLNQNDNDIVEVQNIVTTTDNEVIIDENALVLSDQNIVDSGLKGTQEQFVEEIAVMTESKIEDLKEKESNIYSSEKEENSLSDMVETLKNFSSTESPASQLNSATISTTRVVSPENEKITSLGMDFEPSQSNLNPSIIEHQILEDDDNVTPQLYSEDYLRSLDGIKSKKRDRSIHRKAFKKQRSSGSSNSSMESRVSRDEELEVFTSLEEEEMKRIRENFQPIIYTTGPQQNIYQDDKNSSIISLTETDSDSARQTESKMDEIIDFDNSISSKIDQKGTNNFNKAKDKSKDETNTPNTLITSTTPKLIFSGEYTKAMDKDWHSSHFCCWQCDDSLTGQRYVIRDDHPYCIKCYENVFANPCEECHKIIGIDSKDLSYKDKHWHEACFLCCKCHISLVDKQFGAKADRIYCGNCYDAQFASRCDGCGEVFRAGTKKMEYKTRQWHENCFCCCVCHTAIGTKSFIPREQEIYCTGCYEEKFATRCIKCNKVITSGGVTYKNEPWHRECFTCTNCKTALAGQRFTSRDEKPYCADCFGELFAKRCTSCVKPITGIGGTRFISFEDRHWHHDCFVCANCTTSLVGRGFITDGPDIICPECAKQKLM